MNNPWTLLPAKAPFVLESDRPAVEAFNGRARDDHRIRLEIVPEPYLGDPRAPVLLLNLNPGFVETDKVVHLDPAFNAAARANLEHTQDRCPFYLLDPALPSPGQDWWMRKLRALIGEAGLDSVAANVFVAEIHGYHSPKFSARLRVPSQEYTRALVLDALNRRAEVVVMRGLRQWLALVPEIKDARPTIVRSVQNPTISPGNVDSFSRIVRAVTRS